jgi:hypothetical protein
MLLAVTLITFSMIPLPIKDLSVGPYDDDENHELDGSN